MSNIVSVSILNADLANLADEIKKIEASKADMIHFDVMDGIFVNNISFGVPVLKAIKGLTGMFMDVHLMITDPYKYIGQFAGAGADMITFHAESSSDPAETIKKIHGEGLKAGFAINPDTPAEAALPYLDMIDTILVMSVRPGFGGQAFIEETLHKVRIFKSLAEKSGKNTCIQIDGGINDKTGRLAVNAGAGNLVSGSYLFKSGNMPAAVKLLKGL